MSTCQKVNLNNDQMAIVDTFGKLTLRKLTISPSTVWFIRKAIFNDCQNSTCLSSKKFVSKLS
jgi:hypothetical protein